MNKAGWYSIVRFVPDLFRGEGVNLGVVVMVPADRFLECRITSDCSRARQFFGGAVDDTRLALLAQGLEQALAEEGDDIWDDCQWTSGQLAQHTAPCLGLMWFINRQQDMLRLTDSRSCTVDGTPDEELARLFARLVSK